MSKIILFTFNELADVNMTADRFCSARTATS